MPKLCLWLSTIFAGLLVAGPVYSQGAEYQEQSSGHQTGVSAAHRFRPNDPAYLKPYREKALARLKAERPNLEGRELENAIQDELAPIVGLADGLMQEMVCLCGGCGRETLHECKCGFAAGERQVLLTVLSQHDLSTAAGRKGAKEAAVAAFVDKHGGEHVLGNTRNPWAWLVPYIAAACGLLLLFAFGRRWVARGQGAERDGSAVDESEDDEDDDYADRLDDELRETD